MKMGRKCKDSSDGGQTVGRGQRIETAKVLHVTMWLTAGAGARPRAAKGWKAARACERFPSASDTSCLRRASGECEGIRTGCALSAAVQFIGELADSMIFFWSALFCSGVDNR
jgi:hypothetical protein